MQNERRETRDERRGGVLLPLLVYEEGVGGWSEAPSGIKRWRFLPILIALMLLGLIGCASLFTSVTSEQVDQLRGQFVGKQYWSKGPLKRYVDSDERGVSRMVALHVTDVKIPYGVWLFLEDSLGHQGVVQLLERSESYDSARIARAVSTHLWDISPAKVVDSLSRLYPAEAVNRALLGKVASGDGIGLLVLALGNPDSIATFGPGRAFDAEWFYTQARKTPIMLYLLNKKLVSWSPEPLPAE